MALEEMCGLSNYFTTSEDPINKAINFAEISNFTHNTVLELPPFGKVSFKLTLKINTVLMHTFL